MSALPSIMSLSVIASRLLLVATTCAAVSLGFFTRPAPIEACGNEYVKMYLLPVATRRITRAEALMAQGNSRAAYGVAREVADAVADGHAMDRPNDYVSGESWFVEEDVFDESTWRQTAPTTAHPDRAASLESRAKMLRAILIVRLDGQIARNGRAARRVHPSVRDEQLSRARADLESLASSRSDDPRVAAYLAEALALVEESEVGRARDTLRDLAARDLIGDPLTWVALARLEGEGAAREVALDGCRAVISRRADRVCVVPAA